MGSDGITYQKVALPFETRGRSPAIPQAGVLDVIIRIWRKADIELIVGE